MFADWKPSEVEPDSELATAELELPTRFFQARRHENGIDYILNACGDEFGLENDLVQKLLAASGFTEEKAIFVAATWERSDLLGLGGRNEAANLETILNELRQV